MTTANGTAPLTTVTLTPEQIEARKQQIEALRQMFAGLSTPEKVDLFKSLSTSERAGLVADLNQTEHGKTVLKQLMLAVDQAQPWYKKGWFKAGSIAVVSAAAGAGVGVYLSRDTDVPKLGHATRGH